METDRIPLVDSIPAHLTYVLMTWPDVQELMDYQWFQRECYVHQSFDDRDYIPSAYFVPIKRILELRKQVKPWFLLLETY